MRANRQWFDFPTFRFSTSKPAKLPNNFFQLSPTLSHSNMVGSETKLTHRTKSKTDMIPYGVIKTTAKGKETDKLMDQHQ
jgi:hypothetical protein